MKKWIRRDKEAEKMMEEKRERIKVAASNKQCFKQMDER
jgi:hypothetical protein